MSCFLSTFASRKNVFTYSSDIGGSFPRAKRSGPEANHSTPSIAEVKNEWH